MLDIHVTGSSERMTQALKLSVTVGLIGLGLMVSASGAGGPAGPVTTSQNPFGVMLPSKLVRAPGGIQVAKVLGVFRLRPVSVFVDQWNGTCVECDIALDAGLQLVLTVRNNGPRATTPPVDLAAYQRTLSQVLDKYRSVLLVVENEENSALFYTGTPEEYAAQLRAACEVAHQKRISCTNGGLVSTLVALLVYNHYLETGQLSAAQNFASRVFTAEEQQLLNSPRAREQIRKGKALLSYYRAAGADYVNFPLVHRRYRGAGRGRLVPAGADGAAGPHQ